MTVVESYVSNKIYSLCTNTVIITQTHAKKNLAASDLENWRRPPGRPRTVDSDYPVGPEIQYLSLNEAIDVAQNRPL